MQKLLLHAAAIQCQVTPGGRHELCAVDVLHICVPGVTQCTCTKCTVCKSASEQWKSTSAFHSKEPVCGCREQPLVSPRVLAQWPQTAHSPKGGVPIKQSQAYQPGKVPKRLAMQVCKFFPAGQTYHCLMSRTLLLIAAACIVKFVIHIRTCCALAQRVTRCIAHSHCSSRNRLAYLHAVVQASNQLMWVCRM